MDMKKLVAEFIGTFFLVFTVSMSQNPLAIGTILAIIVYVLGPISGGHFNPAVTIGILANKTIDTMTAVKYIIAQFIGGILAAVVYLVVYGTHFTPGMSANVTFVSAFLVEALFTFALVFVVLNVAVSKKAAGNQYFGAVIGLTIFVGATVGGAISGGAFNPAVGIAPLLVDFQNISANISNIALYAFAPVVGALVASLVYRYFQEKVKSLTPS